MDIPKENFSEWYNTLIKEAELCDLRYNLKGFVVIMPNAADVISRMYRLYEDALEARGHRKSYFPALISEKNLEAEKDHVEGFAPEVFWVTRAGKNELEEKMILRPTSETAMYPMYSLWINGKCDLPLKVYQSCQVWRYETKATRPLIRGREFYWIEAHNVFDSEEGVLSQVQEDMETTEEMIHQSFGVPFLFFRRPQWDKFAGAVDTYAADTMMPDGKTLQLPSTHNLGTNFAKVFNVKYMDDDGEEKPCWQTCYGPCISRIFAAIVSIHGDSRGMVLPFHLANVQAVVIPILRKEGSETVIRFVQEVTEKLAKNYRVVADFSENTPGFKYNHWELNGAAVRVEIGARDIESGKAVVVRRDTGEKESVPFEELPKKIGEIGKEMNASLREKADEWFATMLKEADTMEELKSALENGEGFVRIPFCTDSLEGEGCAEKLKEECSANVRGSRHDANEKPSGKKCIVCGKEASTYQYAARQY
ncbi:proline--tRNA ligase [Candidatus Micrarchaeota archaeon]|nr:proline--tRNA ligase [Candidatus Micrarchaeota archaeon]MBD3417590.1 proline--tRNA ligase [Candidatus Micrarchaeota archaeon]